METRVWLNRSQPQMLYNATMLLYLNAGLSLLFGGFRLLLLPIGQIAAGYGIANERRWGYQLGVAAAFAPAVLRYLVFGFGGILGVNLFSLLFEALLIYLLLHPESRDYQRIWFK